MSDPTPSSCRMHSQSITYQSFTANNPGTGFTSTWINELGFPIFIVGIDVFIGEQGGAITDTSYSLFNLTQNESLISHGIDHYGVPNGVPSNNDDPFWGPCYYLVYPNDVIEFTVNATSYNGPEAVSAGAMLRYLQ